MRRGTKAGPEVDPFAGGHEPPAGGLAREYAKSLDQQAAEGAGKRRRVRWERRAVVQRVVDREAALAGSWEGLTCAPVGKCGRCAYAENVEIRGRLTDDGVTAYPVGIVTCGRVWLCPVCAAKIRARRSIEVELAAVRWVARGGSLVMLTTTIRHERSDPLAQTLPALRGAWEAVQQERRWRLLRKGGLVHTINSLEVTWGLVNGFHPHQHLLGFIAPGVEAAAVLDSLAWFPGVWADRVGSLLPTAPSLERGVLLQALDADAAGYIAKIADEATRADMKGGKGRTLSPWALIDAMAEGEAHGFHMWREYAAATKGKRAIVMSRGLRADLLSDVADLTDEELAAQEVDGRVLEVVPAEVWQRWSRLRNVHGVIEALARLEEWERVLLLGQAKEVR